MPDADQVFETILRTAASAEDEFDYIVALMAIGLKQTEASKAFLFIQVAWGRSVLSKTGVHLSDEYLAFDETGGEVSGRLDTVPWFVKASRSVRYYERHPGFRKVLMGGAEFQAVNQALNAGEQAEDLFLSPVTFTGSMSDEAEAAEEETPKVQEVVTPQVEPTDSAQKPWWKFW